MFCFTHVWLNINLRPHLVGHIGNAEFLRILAPIYFGEAKLLSQNSYFNLNFYSGIEKFF